MEYIIYVGETNINYGMPHMEIKISSRIIFVFGRLHSILAIFLSMGSAWTTLSAIKMPIYRIDKNRENANPVYSHHSSLAF